jgi:hypothetical protein
MMKNQYAVMNVSIITQLTAHMNGIGEEIRCVCDQNDQATLNLGVAPDVCKLQQQARSQTEDDTNHQAAKEHQQEDADRFEQAQDCQFSCRFSCFVFLCCFEEHDSNRVVENTLAKDDGVQLRVDFVGIENGEDCDRVCCRQCCADGHGLDEGDVQTIDVESRP